MKNEEFKNNLELNWINKDKSLLYEYNEDGELVRPKKWVDKKDLRVSEPRQLKHISSHGSNPIEDFENDISSTNMLIKGDNLIALKSLLEIFKEKAEDEKVKCIYIDPPFNTNRAFESYDDNLKSSEWLSMMKDRLYLLKKLLRKDGFIFVHLDDNELFKCKLLMDEIFGSANFVNIISMTTNAPSGFKSTGNKLFSTSNFLLIYSKNKSLSTLSDIYREKKIDTAYNKYLFNREDDYREWEWTTVTKAFCKESGYEDHWEAKDDLGKKEYEALKEDFIIENARNIFRLAVITGGARQKRKETIDKSKENPDEIFVHPNEDLEDFYIINGNQMLFYEDRLVEIDGIKLPAEIITDVWTDISWTGIANEGGVKLKNGKKPEKLIKRILKMSTNEGDLVLDSFFGSGTTGAVAHKMDRKWIGIELIPGQFEKSLERMKKVIDRQNPDKTGISQDGDINWHGGGNFEVYEIGESILSKNGEINWSHSHEDIAKSIFWMFDYKFNDDFIYDGDFDLYLGQKKEKFAFSIISEDAGIIRKEELDNILDLFKEKYGPNKEIEIYTNYGVGVDEKDLPNNLTIRKVPDCILEKYKLGEE